MADSQEEWIPVARIGKTVGLHGDVRLNLLSDFPEQFQKGALFHSDRGMLKIASSNLERGTIRLEGYDNVDCAKSLTNLYLYTTKEASERLCHLQEGEYFWFQIIGLKVVDGALLLGKVREILRLAGTDYLAVDTDCRLCEQGSVAHFLIPYIDRYISKVSLEEGCIYTRDAKAILDAS